jgi:hypothetical protein
VKTQNDASKDMCEINDKNQIREQFISSQTFHRIPGERFQKITAGERFGLVKLEPFVLVAQE